MLVLLVSGHSIYLTMRLTGDQCRKYHTTFLPELETPDQIAVDEAFAVDLVEKVSEYDTQRMSQEC